MQNKPSKAARELHKATKRARKARKQIERELAQWARWQLIRYFMWALVFCLGGVHVLHDTLGVVAVDIPYCLTAQA